VLVPPGSGLLHGPLVS